MKSSKSITVGPLMKLGSSALFIVLCLLQPTAVKAQWTTPDGNGNITNTNTGNVGIGTGATNPTYKLNVTGSEDKSQIRFGLGTTDSGGFLFSGGPTHAIFSGGAGWSGAWFAKGTSASLFQMNTGTITFFTNSALTPNSQFTPSARMHIDSVGNVGVGTTSQTSRFEVVGPGTFVAKFRRTDNSNGGILVESPAGFNPNVALGVNGVVKWYVVSNSTSSDTLQFWESSGTQPRFHFTQSGTLGIGTSMPNTAYKLDVAGQIRSSSGGFVFPDGTVQTTASGSTSTVSAANISAAQFGQNTGGGNYTFPGNVTVNGNIAAKYQDLAEWVESSQELAPGMVVVLDSTRSNQVIAATQSYDSRVAGVISLRPGIALGEQGKGRVLVATTGRVKVKVDARNGPIEIGDLLVTSEREGYAMKSVPVDIGGVRFHRPGTLIGKALEPLAQGTGEILVLLSLQ